MATKRLRVGVIFGGRSGEHEVSLVSATSVINALDRKQYDIVPIGITPQGKWISSDRSLELLKSKAVPADEPAGYILPDPHHTGLVSSNGNPAHAGEIDVAFPLVHGTFGEDGTLQGLFEMADIPYVGAGVLGSALGMDKILQKQVFSEAGLPVPKYRWFLSSECGKNMNQVVREVEDALRYPLFVKPANTGSSVGISKAHDRKELTEAIGVATRYDRKVIVEQGVREAREIEVSVLGNDRPEASLPGEVIPSNEFYDYDAKYVDGKSSIVIPAKLPRSVVKTVRRLAISAFQALDCCGMARVDFLVTRRNLRIYLSEINTIPGFTSISMYPKLWEASGLAYPQLLDRLIALALERHAEKLALKRAYSPRKEWYKA
jgi:D-alanine-D-alanine ligase